MKFVKFFLLLLILLPCPGWCVSSANLAVLNAGYVSYSNSFFPNTTHSNLNGILYKNTAPFLHDFNYGDNGTVTTEGGNLFLGTSVGNTTAGSTATLTTDSSHNTLVGSDIAPGLTIGGGNSLFGANVGTAITEADNNSCFGYGACRSITIGTGNVAAGKTALASATAAAFNTSIGYSALFSTNTSHNVAAGFEALSKLTVGGYDTAVGRYAGKFISDGVTALTDATNSVFMGQYTMALANGDSNEIVIGANAVGNGSNTVTLGDTNITKVVTSGAVEPAGPFNLPSVTADPCAAAPYKAGSMFFNSTSGYPCYCDNALADLRMDGATACF